MGKLFSLESRLARIPGGRRNKEEEEEEEEEVEKERGARTLAPNVLVQKNPAWPRAEQPAGAYKVTQRFGGGGGRFGCNSWEVKFCLRPGPNSGLNRLNPG